jgi:hypothetical protein
LFASMLEPNRVEHILGAHLKGRLTALPANIRLGWNGIPGTNTFGVDFINILG